MYPTTQERVRLVSRLKERTRLTLRVLARTPEGDTTCLGSARLAGIRLNPQGEAQLLVSMQCNNPEFVELIIQDELGKGSAEATYRIPVTGGIGAQGEASAHPVDEIGLLLERVTALEKELELRYATPDTLPSNGKHSRPAPHPELPGDFPIEPRLDDETA